MNAVNIPAAYASEVEGLIESLEVGEAVYYENLTIIPIYSTRIKDKTRYTTLDEALSNNYLEITELSGGNVPQVRLTNRSGKYIYLMGGEILTGCKQDRIVGRDVLIKPHSKNIVVPVYCVEQGRWSYESDKFYSKGNLGTHDLRYEAQSAVGASQGNIWGRIRSRASRVGVNSNTNAYQDIYETTTVKDKIVCFEREFQGVPQLDRDTIGVVVGVGSRIVSVDIFANHYLFEKLWPKLLKSCALSALSSSTHGSISQDDAAQFLRILHDKHYIRKSAIDLGFELSVVDDEVNVNALVYRKAVVHLAGFPAHDSHIGMPQHYDSERRVPVMRR